MSVLDGIAEIHKRAKIEARKRKRGEHDEGIMEKKKRNLQEKSAEDDTEVDETSQLGGIESHAQTEIADSTSKSPSILAHLTFGINQVTKLLERTSGSQGHTTVSDISQVSDSQLPSSKLVVVCRRDVNPPILIGHLPNLVAACNSSRYYSSSENRSQVWLVQLPQGAEQSLAAVTGLRRVATLAIDVGYCPWFS